jgi:type II secretory pathway pseudopilin PulG
LKRFLTQAIDKLYRDERGTTLVEALFAIAILGGGILTIILAMSTGALAIQENDEQAVAQSLARTQLEYVKNYAYDAGAVTYPAVSAPEGYGINVGVSATPDGDGEIQKITANVTREGAVILTAEDYKVNR